MSQAQYSESNEVTPHSEKQERIILSDHDLTIAGCGTQFGKSMAGALWIKRMMHEYTDPSDNFLICAPTYKILKQSIIPYFLHYMEGFGKYRQTDNEFKIHGGGTTYFRTETDPNSIVGVPNVRAGWLDEAGLLRLYFWENYVARALAKGAKTLLTTSPYSLNWIWKDLVKPAQAGLRPDINLIRAASWENPYHTLFDPVKRAEAKAKMDPRRWDMLFGGEWGQAQGLVYDCFDEDYNTCDPFTLPQGTRYYGGIDWGYTEPFVLTVRAITPAGEHYQVSEFYKSGLSITPIIQMAKQKKLIYNIELFYCGPDQPGYIQEFNNNGLPAIAADNDVRVGIDAHYELIKTRRYKIFRGSSPFTMDELSTYHYPEDIDPKPDEKVKDRQPVQQNDHASDSNRYMTISKHRANVITKPKHPGLNPTQVSLDQHFKNLMKPKHMRYSE